MANKWIEFVKQYAKDQNIPYRQALKEATSAYKGAPVKGAPSKTKPGEIDYSTKKGDVVFHEMGKDVKKSRKPYTKTKKTDLKIV